jgi:hypothetical protein
VGPRAGLDAVVKKNTQLLPGLAPPIIQPVARRYTAELFRVINDRIKAINVQCSKRDMILWDVRRV